MTKISPAPFTNAQMQSYSKQKLKKLYAELGSKLERTGYGRRMLGHIVMKSRKLGPDPERSMGMVPANIVRMYPNGERLLSVFNKLNAYNKEQTTVTRLRNIINARKNV